jgi:hypothetical protein
MHYSSFLLEDFFLDANGSLSRFHFIEKKPGVSNNKGTKRKTNARATTGFVANAKEQLKDYSFKQKPRLYSDLPLCHLLFAKRSGITTWIAWSSLGCTLRYSSDARPP